MMHNVSRFYSILFYSFVVVQCSSLKLVQEWYLYRVSHKIGIDKKLLFGAAQGLNLQFLNLFGFSISVSFVWCII